MTKWKSIETAPKDGSWILVARTGIGSMHPMPPAIVRWREKHRLIKQDKGKNAIYEGCWEGVDTGSMCLCQPRWWMALPAHPSNKSGIDNG